MANEDLLLRQAPHSLEAEQAVLGSMLIDADCVKLVMDKLRPDDFYLRQNREIFDVILGMFVAGASIDGITVAEEMKIAGKYEENTTRPYLAQLMEITPTSANVMEYAAIVADKALLRAVALAASETLDFVRGGGADGKSALELLESRAYAIRGGQGASGMKALKETLPGVLDRIGRATEDFGQGKRLRGLSTGFSALDRKILGLKGSNLIMLAARPGMGKTALAANIAVHVAGTDKAVAVFSLEMSNDQLAERILSGEALVGFRELWAGERNLNERDWEKIAAATVTLSRKNILINDNSALTVADISAKCRRIDNLGLVIVDYLQLMEAGGTGRRNDNRQQEVARMSRALKMMAKSLNVPVLCLSQLSRANEKREGKRPQLSDLRDSGAIEQDADIVMFLYRDGYYNEESENLDIAECIVAKNRHGDTGTVKLRWMKDYTMFATLEEWRA